MKTYAQVLNNLIVNRGIFKDNADIPTGWIDVTETGGNIGDPLDGDGVPIPQPSEYHTVTDENDGWRLTSENAVVKDEADAQGVRSSEISVEQQSSGMKADTVTGAHDKIEQIFDGIRSKPTDTEQLGALINKCELLFKKIAVELLR